MRTMTPAMAEELDRSVKRPALFYEGEFESGSVRIWTGDHDVEFNGETFVSATRFAGTAITAIEETGEVNATGIAVSLSGVPLDMLQIAIEEARQGMAGTVWLGFVTDGIAAEYDYDLTPGTLPAGVTYAQPTADFDGSRIDADGVLQYASGPDEPRWDHRWDGSAFVLAGLLNEPARTNIRSFSEAVNSWSNTATIVSIDAAVAPDGATTADRMEDNAAGTSGQTGRNLSVTNLATGLWAMTAFIAPGSLDWLRFRTQNFTQNTTASFDAASGAFGGNNSFTSSFVDRLAGAWFRAGGTVPEMTGPDMTGLFRWNLADGNADDTVLRDGTKNIYLWGGGVEQVETGDPFASSYIRNTGSGSATRAAGVTTITQTPQGLPLPDGTYDITVTRWGIADQVLTGVEVTGNAWAVPTATAPLRRVRMLRRRPEGALVADPAIAFAGRLDVPEIDDNGQTATITISYESRLVDLERPRERRYTHEDQQIDYSGDLGFEYVAAIQEWNGVWGRS